MTSEVPPAEAGRLGDRLEGDGVSVDATAANAPFPVRAGGQTGRFRYDVTVDRWEWDENVYALHGYRPGEIEPTTEVFLQHKHVEDRPRVEAVFRSAIVMARRSRSTTGCGQASWSVGW